MYLNRAERARERAQRAETAVDRAFHQRMEASWMRLAASSSLVERADLFFHTLQAGVVPYDACASCQGIMMMETVDAERHQEIYRMKCDRCGWVEHRIVVR